MYSAHLRKSGGSVILAIPPALLDLLHIQTNDEVILDVEDGQLLVTPKDKPRYSLKSLLAECDASAGISPEEAEWLNDKPVGKELL